MGHVRRVVVDHCRTRCRVCRVVDLKQNSTERQVRLFHKNWLSEVRIRPQAVSGEVPYAAFHFRLSSRRSLRSAALIFHRPSFDSAEIRLVVFEFETQGFRLARTE